MNPYFQSHMKKQIYNFIDGHTIFLGGRWTYYYAS